MSRRWWNTRAEIFKADSFTYDGRVLSHGMSTFLESVEEGECQGHTPLPYARSFWVCIDPLVTTIAHERFCAYGANVWGWRGGVWFFLGAFLTRGAICHASAESADRRP